MKETPIILNTAMVRAILDGRKTQTRRPINPQPVDDSRPLNVWIPGSIVMDGMKYQNIVCPFGSRGDRLWVRETWAFINNSDFDAKSYVEYRADKPDAKYPGDWPEEEARGNPDAPKWCPSTHMPKKYCRIWLEITDVRVERLQDISEEDAKDEGVHSIWGFEYCHPLEAFYQLWEKINGKKHPWSSNPWVWVIEFKKAQN